MCGLFGIISKDEQPFDYSTFCTLGIANDTRGGDSCGYFIDGHYEYGIKENKYFQNFFVENEFLNNVKTSTIALGHCRKASVGTIDETTAQPVVIYNDNGCVDYVLMHNGTIYNYKDLAKKYIPNISIKDLTDSQVMALIFYHTGYKAINEYNGAAVFVIVDYRNKVPKVFLFKGESKKIEYSKETSEERPLYICIDKSKKEMVFSSIYTYLYALRKDIKVYSIGSNVLVEFTGDDVEIIEEMDRSKMIQSKIHTPQIFYNTSIYNNYFFDSYDEVFSDFIIIDQTNNTYSNGTKLHGKIMLTNYGRILDQFIKNCNCKIVYFWRGIALKSKTCFYFLKALQKKYNLDDKTFDLKFENIIRFLSIDGIYIQNNIWVKAISPQLNIPFTGTLNMLTSRCINSYKNGIKTTSRYSNPDAEYAYDIFGNNKININFKNILKECKSMMK